MLTGNIAVTGASVVNSNNQPLTTVNVGEWVYIQTDFTTLTLPSNASYRVATTVNGLKLDSSYITWGAGSSGTGSWDLFWGTFLATPGTNQVTVTVDPDHSVPETTYADNTLSFTFNAVSPAVGPFISYTAAQMRNAYGVNSIPNFGSAAPDGSGQTIAIINQGNDPSVFADVDGFDQTMSLTTSSTESIYQSYGAASSFLTVYNQYGVNITANIANSGSNGVPALPATSEESWDVEWAHAMAPGAKIDEIEFNTTGSLATNVLTSYELAGALPGVTAANWSGGLSQWSTESVDDSSVFVTPSGHVGVTFVCPSNDNGANVYPSYGQGDGYYPSTSPNVLSVGGTTLTLNNDGYGGETGWSFPTPTTTVNNGSAGYSQTGTWSSQAGGFSGTYSTATGGSSSTATWTIPVNPADTGWGTELSATWTASPGNATNPTYTVYDGTAATGTVLGTMTINQTQGPAGTADGSAQFQELGVFFPTLNANGDGTLTVVVNAQSANGTVVADAIGAAPAWASSGGPAQFETEPTYQMPFQSTGYRTTPDVSFDANFSADGYGGGEVTYGGGGTSLGGPCWTGLMAVINQGRVAGGGEPLNSPTDPTQTQQAIYSLPATDFHDITTGYNGFFAGPGYDFVTGRGTPIANLLVPDMVAYDLLHQPSVTNATTADNTQSTSGLVITSNSADTAFVTNFQITNITGGTLYLNDGVTQVTDNEFITVAQGAAGLKFTPATNSLTSGSFTVQESTSATTAGLGGTTATATIAVNLVLNQPSVTDATTTDNTQTTSGLVMTPNSADTAFVTNFQITNITGGTLYLNNGTTQVTDNEFITVAQGAAGLKFTPATNSLASGSFTVQESTSATTTGLGGPTATATITVNPLPVLNGPAAVSLRENGTLTFSGANTISVTDTAGSGNDTVTVTLTVSQGTLSLGDSSNVNASGNGTPASPLVVSYLLSGVNEDLPSLVYTPTAGYSGPDTMNVSVQDNVDQGTGVPIQVAISVDPTFTAPLTASVTENTSLVFSTANSNAISLVDGAASGSSDSLTLSVTHGTLTLSSTTGLTFTAGANSTATMTVTGTQTDLNTDLNGLTYKPSANFTGTDTLALSVLDSGNKLTGSASVAITVTGPPAPVVTVPSSASVAENTGFTFSAAQNDAITLADAFASPTSTDQLTLKVSHGTLALATTSGLTFTSGGNNTAAMTVKGTLAALNAAVDGLVYTPTTGFKGSASLTISLKDTKDGLTGSGSVAITVTPPAPTITAPATVSLYENQTATFSTTQGDAITLADAGASTKTLDSLTLQVTNGKLKLATTSGLTFTSGANNSPSMTVTGTLTKLSAALNGLIYTPTTGYKGSDTLSLSLKDSGDNLTGSASVAITVRTPPAPVVTAPPTASVTENTNFTFSTAQNDAITGTDAYALATYTEQLTLKVSHGTLALASTTGLTFSSGANDSASMTVKGTLAAINAALNGLVYTPTTGFTGSDSLSISLKDTKDGLTGSAKVAITVIAPAIANTPSSGAITVGTPMSSSSQGATDDGFDIWQADEETRWAGLAAALDVLGS